MPLGARGRRARSRPRPAEEDRIIDVAVFERGHVTCWVGSLSGGHPGRPAAADRRPPMAYRWLRRPVQTGRAVAGRVRWRARLWRDTRLLGDWLRLEVRPCTAGDRTAGAPAGHRRGPRAQPRDLANVHYMPGDDPVPVFFDGLDKLLQRLRASRWRPATRC